MNMPKAIGFEIKMLANMIGRALNETSIAENEKQALTGMQGWVIAYMVANEGRDIYQRDLEKDFNIRRATVTGVLKLMERSDLIIRLRVAHDARLKKLKLTSKAYELHDLNVQSYRDLEARLSLGLSQEEITMFYVIMKKLKRNIQ